MKTVALQCPGCGREIELSEEHADRPVRCATCGTPVGSAASEVTTARRIRLPAGSADSVTVPPGRNRLVRVLLAGLLGGVVLGGVVFSVLWASYFAPSEFDADFAYLPDECDFFVSMQGNQVAGSDLRVEYLSRMQEYNPEKPGELVGEFGLGHDEI